MFRKREPLDLKGSRRLRIMAKALGPATRKGREEVKSSIWLMSGVSTLSPVPMR